MNYKAKIVVFWIVLIGVAALLWGVARNEHVPANATYSKFLQQIQSGEVNRATIIASHGGADRVTYELKSGSRVNTIVPADDRSLLEILQQKMVEIEIRDASAQWPRILANSSPFLLLLVAWFFMFNRLRAKPGAQ
jgi:cell division protease FtsH